MSFGFVLLCLVAGAVPLAILYVLYGPTQARPIVPVPRASLLALPQRARTAPVYQPERVFAVEQAGLIADVSQRIHLAPRSIATPPPVPRARLARGSDSPPLVRATTPVRGDATQPNPFTDEGPTHFG